MAACLVTGAGGFIGKAVVRALAAAGLRVHAATRDGRPPAPNIAARRLDLRDRATIAQAVAGMECVVHCAVGNRAVTVEGTRTLLQQARAAGVRRVVHFSSIAVYGGARGEVTEACPRVPEHSGGYAGWKAAAEAACAAARDAGLEVVILRPAIVYGPGSQPWVARPARRLLSGCWGSLGAAGEGICNLVHVDDVARAACAALTVPAARGAFNISSERITWNQWHALLAQAMGLPPLRALSPAVLRRRAVLALPAKALARLLRRTPPALAAAPSFSELRLFALDACYPAVRAQAELGWSPQVPLQQGLADSVAWLRQERLLDLDAC